jgi:hypothetical protein
MQAGKADKQPPPRQLATLLMQTLQLYARNAVRTSVSVAADEAGCTIADTCAGGWHPTQRHQLPRKEALPTGKLNGCSSKMLRMQQLLLWAAALTAPHTSVHHKPTSIAMALDKV